MNQILLLVIFDVNPSWLIIIINMNQILLLVIFDVNPSWPIIIKKLCKNPMSKQKRQKPKSAGNTKNLDRKLDQYLGIVLRQRRISQGLKVSDIAKLAGISQGMLSRIENAQVSTSLDTLQRVCDALGLHISQLFKDFDRPEGTAQHIKNNEGLEVVKRGTERGHTYHLLSYQQGPQKNVEPFLVMMDDASEVFPTFSHPGTEFLYLLEGKLEYRHGNHTYLLEPGDSLTFDGEIPHGPEQLHTVPIKLLSIMNYGEKD